MARPRSPEGQRTGARITIRVSGALRAAIAEAAEADRRSVAGWVAIAVEDAVRAWRAAHGMTGPLPRTPRRRSKVGD